MIIEVIIQNHKDMIDAQKAGADRVELVSAISEGGLTPSIGTVQHVCKHATIPVFTMIRPHSFSFQYSKEDKDIILSDIEKVKEYGSSGIVFGALTNERTIDFQLLEAVIKAAHPLPITFHRAIDASVNPIHSYKLLCKYTSIERVLTSGGADFSYHGVSTLREMVLLQHQLNGPTVMPGAGLSPNNFKLINDSVGAHEYHFGVGVRSEESYLSDISAAKVQRIKNLS